MYKRRGLCLKDVCIISFGTVFYLERMTSFFSNTILISLIHTPFFISNIIKDFIQIKKSNLKPVIRKLQSLQLFMNASF